MNYRAIIFFFVLYFAFIGLIVSDIEWDNGYGTFEVQENPFDYPETKYIFSGLSILFVFNLFGFVKNIVKRNYTRENEIIRDKMGKPPLFPEVRIWFLFMQLVVALMFIVPCNFVALLMITWFGCGLIAFFAICVIGPSL